ncbi:MAG: excinuclease ABC subunit UvrA, partial [Methylacidiphilales bacterium]|nr:excinuclease ABC subunit UvrA [Candidatus Methylacidiphilales bacterium]
MAHDFIRVEGARTHNLKNISLSIPHHKITVLTGPSGSGKSSLAFHTLYAEGQRRYVETFSPYTRQFLDRMPKPDVDRIEGIPPAIAIEQANAVKTSRSTVGTMTEIADYLKLLFPRLAVLYSDDGQQKIHPYTPREAWDELCKAWPERDCIVVFEVKFPRHTPLSEALSFVQTQGFTRVWLDHAVVRIEELLQDASNLNTTLHTLPVVLDRLRVAAENTSRAVEAIEMAYHYGQETVIFLSYDATSRRVGAEKRFTSQWRDPYTGKSYRAPTPEQFTFNHPIGACPRCHGFGRVIEIDYNLALPDRSLSIRQGVVKPFRGEQGAEWQRELLRFCQAHRIDVDAPFNSLPQEVQNLILFGQTDSHTGSSHAQPKSMPSWPGVAGYFRWLETKTYKMHVRVLLSRYRAYLTCPECKGDRFARETLQYKLNHPTTPLTIAEINALPLHQALHYFETLSHTALDEVSLRLTQEIITRLRYLNHIGLGYLHLNRASRTLSGGEIQRVNLTVCLGNSLVNTLFVLDEPTIGLHPHDNDRLISAMRLLRDRGNTLLVVEHDEMVITSADHLIEIGPGSGLEGGQIVAQGTPSEILADPRTLTAQWLRSDRAPTPLSTTTDAPPSDYIRILQAHANNLKHINVDIPLARFVAVTGVSGSGKSTLIHEVLVKNINRVRSGISQAYEGCEALHGAEKIQDLIIVDQSPLTKTPRSNPVIYSGAYEAIRQLFASTDEAIRRGLDASSFSFNSDSGRCPHCQGAGYERVTMQFLADVWIQCPVCNGRRFQNHILQVEYRGRTIDQILDFTVDQSIDFFSKTIRTPLSSHHSNPQSLPRERLLRQKIVQALTALAEVGLGYLKLGQPLNQLSGGEAQRLKLMSHMSGITSPQDDSSESDEDEITENSQPSNSEALDSRSTDHNSLSQARHKLLILDEPTTGLHFREVQLLIQVLRKLVNQGYSLIVIEHQLDLIQSADWIIDLGPGAGEHGGEIVACGTPYDIANHPQSLTGRYLSQRLNKKSSPITLTAPIQLENHINEEPSNSAARKAIILRGAREHNLKNINTQFELGKFHVITGLSGSGKSTLAFDILFAEGQRRYLDSLNVYARQFVEQLSKPDVDQITGLPPSVAIEQRRSRGGAKSTVATVTEIYHFLRLLYAKLGVPHDPDNGEPAQKINPDALVEKILSEIKKKKELTILAPIIKSRKGYHADVAQWAMRNQYPYLRIDGKWIKPTHFKKLDRYVEHTIDVVLGNVSSKKTRIENEKCLREGLLIGNGTIYTLDNQKNETIYSRHWYCPTSGRSFDEPDPRWFSFNSPHGWCPTCEGHGVVGAEELEREIQGEEIRHELVQTCPTCSGERLNAIARAVRLPYGKWGQRERTSLRKGKQKTQESCGPRLPELMRLPLTELQAYLQTISLKGRDARIAADLLKEIHQRLNFLCEVGLDYLTL